MGRITTEVPNLNINLVVDNIVSLDGITKVQITDNKIIFIIN